MLITCICTGRNKNLVNAGWLHTPVVGNSLNTAYKCRLHKPAVCKSLRSPLMCWSHTPAVGKSLRNKPKCWSDTPAQGKSLMVVLTRWSHTPAVGKSLNGYAYMLVAYTCSGQKSRIHAYTVIAYTCGGQKSRWHAYTVIACTCGGQKTKVRAPELPRIPFHALRGPLTPVWGPNSLKSPQKWPKRPFFRLSCPITQPPGGGFKKRPWHAVRLDPRIIPAKFHPNPSTFRASLCQKTDERRGTPPPTKGRSATLVGALPPHRGSLRDLSLSLEPPWKREPPRFARWLIN